MRKRRKSFLWAALLIIMALTAGTAFGETKGALAAKEGEARVYDLADLFSDEEEEWLSEEAGRLRERMEMDAAIVTTDDNDGSAEEFADGFYEAAGFGTGEDHSGILFLIDMDNRELYLSTEGRMLRYMTDSRVEAVLDDVYGYAADQDYYGAAMAFLEDVERCYENGIAKNQYNYDTETGKISRYHSLEWYEILFALAVAAVCGGTAAAGVVRSYGLRGENVRMAVNFKLSYRKDSAFTLGNILADVLLGTYVTRQLIASAGNNNRSGGGGFSGGGRTSTHRSGSGRSHGGGGRKF